MAGMFGWNLLVATTESGELLLYSVPLREDVNQPVWEERINAGIDTNKTIQIMAYSFSRSQKSKNLRIMIMTHYPAEPFTSGLSVKIVKRRGSTT